MGEYWPPTPQTLGIEKGCPAERFPREAHSPCTVHGRPLVIETWSHELNICGYSKFSRNRCQEESRFDM
jgi:hypothetical protein